MFLGLWPAIGNLSSYAEYMSLHVIVAFVAVRGGAASILCGSLIYVKAYAASKECFAFIISCKAVEQLGSLSIP